ncbi:membrane protein [Leptolinea sp. HRD-7]|nr:membrane protein [Leptolinea sp. HRD-7]
MRLIHSFTHWLDSIDPEKGWFLHRVLGPFIVTRLCWLVTAYYAVGNYLPNPTYQRYVDRGFYMSKVFLLDIFTRWDSAQYLTIIKGGYAPSADLRTQYSNIAFFPLYPYLVKSIGWLGVTLPDGFYVAFGLLLSNLFFLAGAVLLYRLTIQEFHFSPGAAAAAIGLLMVFPTGFIFSCFYTESLFFFLTVLCFTLAFQSRWGWAALTAGLLLVTRAQGLVVWGILFVFYLERSGWSIRRIRPDIGSLILSPIGLAAHLYHLFRLTGEPLAPFVAMTAWGRANTSILSNLWENVSSPVLDVFKIDLIFSLLFIAVSLVILIKWPQKSIGLLAVALSVMPIASGLLVSASRYLLLVFPVFMYLGARLEKSRLYDPLRAVLFTLQIVYFAGWVNYYWIV